MGFGQQQLRAFSLAALGQFNRDTSTLPHFSDGKIVGEPIVDQIKENSSIPSNMTNGSGHTRELYCQFFHLYFGSAGKGGIWSHLGKTCRREQQWESTWGWLQEKQSKNHPPGVQTSWRGAKSQVSQSLPIPCQWESGWMGLGAAWSVEGVLAHGRALE